ncbi:MAG: phenylalanine--tRNA ligase subunit alpha [Chlorobi bacterium]|nr:phenylalanine--tRNA ligase subunit alpha [Chlorobiota bacterium]
MLENIEKYIEEVRQFEAAHLDEVEQFRIRFAGRKGLINKLFDEFKQVPKEEKPRYGQLLNTLKKVVAEKVEDLKSKLQNQAAATPSGFDPTRPGYPYRLGSRHPVSLVRNRIIDIFRRIGFNVSYGPEIEDDWHNFTALNLPEYHPARDMQDTFFVELHPDWLLRTHTSSVQIRYMEQNRPPIRTVSPGRVYRNEDISARSHLMFHQVEGLYVDTDVSFADLKQTLLYFTREMFGENSRIRLRPSYFPFTEPSAEVDIYWGLKTETDYRITKGTGWLEIMGAGMVDPNVLANMNIDPEKYSGFAFGMGIERIAMLLYQIPDIRLLFENDLGFLKQFKSVL